MSFGGNPPWQRNSLGNANQQSAIASLQSQMMNSNFVGFQNMAMAQQAPQNNLSLIPPIGANIGALNNTGPIFTNQHQSMQFQTARSGLNPNAFSSVQQAQMNPNNNNNNQSGQNMYKGQNDANFNNNPWNTMQSLSGSGHNINMNQAQISVQQPQQQSRNFSTFNSLSQSQNASYSASIDRTMSSSRGSNHSSRQSPSRRSSLDRSSRREQDEERRRRDKDREREREREREKEKNSREKRDDRSPIRRISPKRRARPIPRYNVQIPNNNLTETEADVLELRRRYSNLYVPSEFFWSSIKWSESFPPHTPFSLQKPCSFHVFHKSVANPNVIGKDIDAELNPSDADSSFSAKVMLMGVPQMKEFYRRCFASAEERDKEDLVHPTRLINFLVGMFGNKEAAPIGGPWSPSLDGENPEKDPSVLIRTAIRTCKVMSGIDLSACTQWYRFVELYYRRAETIRKGRIIPAKTQTVVIFLPDIRSVIPTRIEWDSISVKYKRHMEMELRKDASGTSGSSKRKSKTSTSEQIIDGSTLNVIDEVGDDSNQDKMEMETETDNGNLKKDDTLDLEGKIGKDQATTTTNNQKDDQNPTKHESSNNSELDVKNMKMNDLRDELDARGLSSKGLKPQLVARLSKALKTEENEAIANDASAESIADDVPNQNMSKGSNEDEFNDGMDIDMADIVVIDEYDSTKTDSKHDESSKKDSSKKIDQREQRWFERHYKLPENPAILCHPAQHSSLDKFTCEVMSLSVLLDYRPDDMKKHCFEVSLFAELFNEMLMRDFGFNIYKMLYSLPEVNLSADEKSNQKSDDEDPKEKRPRKETESKDTDSKNHKKDGSNNGANSEHSKSGKDSKDKEKGHKERRASRKDEESDDETRSLRSSDAKKREHKKLITVNPDLLLSFVYFDQTHCGYIFSHHLEELFYALGLRLSRADTKKIVSKVAPRSLLYRKLTDKPKDEKSEPPAKETEEEIIEIGKGNNSFLPIFQLNSKITTPQEQVADENKKSDADTVKESEGDSSEAHMVMHKGALIDIEKLLQQLKRSEKAREETELRLVELTKTNTDLQTSSSKAKDKVKDLQSDLKSCNRKLSDFEATLSSTNKKCSEYHSILSGIHDKVSPIFVKSERSKKESATRDKDRRDREKEKTNSSSSSKEKDIKQEKSSETKTEVKQEEN